MIRINTNSTTAVAIRASLCKSAAYPISKTMFAVMVLTPLNNPLGRASWIHATLITAIDSPIARPTPSITPAITPEAAAGRTTLNTLLS